MSDFTPKEMHVLKKLANLSDEQINRMIQVACPHIKTEDFSEYSLTPIACGCCGNFDQICLECNLVINHECYEHNPYCHNCS